MNCATTSTSANANSPIAMPKPSLASALIPSGTSGPSLHGGLCGRGGRLLRLADRLCETGQGGVGGDDEKQPRETAGDLLGPVPGVQQRDDEDREQPRQHRGEGDGGLVPGPPGDDVEEDGQRPPDRRPHVSPSTPRVTRPPAYLRAWA